MTRIHRRTLAARLGRSLVAAALLAGAASAHAQDAADYPNKPVRVIVPYAAGGGTDIAARLIAAKLGERLGQRFVVDNRPGAGGSLGTEVAVRSVADGYTLLFHSGTLAVDPSFKKKLPYDVRKDLAPVSLVVSGPFFLVINPQLPVKNAGDLIAYARANPKKLNFGSPGIGSSIHLAGEVFKSMAGIDVQHVPYKGNAPAMQGLIGGEIHFLFDLISLSKPMVDSGKIRMLGVSSLTRSADIPDLPTISESGLPGYDTSVWLGMLAPAGVPRGIVNKISAAIRSIVESPDVRAQLRAQGFEPIGNSPDEFAAFLAKDIERYGKVIREAKIEEP
jgi:hypothetical protein